MNREIKFRAWDKVAKKMYQHYAHIGANTRLYVVWLKDDTDPAEIDLVLMQYTGLKDKNGKEIYEGDILATENDSAEFDQWSTQDNGYTAVVWSEDADGWIGSNWTWDKMNDRESIYDISFCKVIGNIYENPELLEKEV